MKRREPKERHIGLLFRDIGGGFGCAVRLTLWTTMGQSQPLLELLCSGDILLSHLPVTGDLRPVAKGQNRPNNFKVSRDERPKASLEPEMCIHL